MLLLKFRRFRLGRQPYAVWVLVCCCLCALVPSTLAQTSTGVGKPEQTKNTNHVVESTWTDTTTGLIWTKKDNGSNVNWNQASAYCQSLRLGGNSDWRLPVIDELQRIYTQSRGFAGSHVKGGIDTNGYTWSNSAGDASGEAWFFSFDGGGRHSIRLGVSYFFRALCVRRSVAQGTQSDQPTPWRDQTTGLMWTGKDNGVNLTWDEATGYCQDLKLSGDSDWRLPVIDELAAIYDQTQSVNGWRIKGGIHITGILWSNSAGDTSGEAWDFGFVDGGGGRYSTPLGGSDYMRALCVRRFAPEGAQSPPWRDQTTGLMWTKRDNDSDVNWQQAKDYCQNLHVMGTSDWRLPTIDELKGIYDPGISVRGRCCGGYAVDWHVKGELQLSGDHWSSSQGDASGEALYFAFNNGNRYSGILGLNNNVRALCVRRSGD